MAVSVEELQIEINAKAKDANTAIDNLADKLGKLSASLGGLKNATGLTTLAQGVERLSTAMQTMSGVETREFTRVAKGIAKLNDASFSNLASVATNVNHMATALNNLGNVTENAMSIGEMAKNIAKLGNKSVQTAITNIPQLAVAMRDLLTTLSTAPNVSRNIIDMTNALANLANQGSRVGSASRSIVRGMNNTTSSMNRARKSTTSLAAAFGKFYATWFLVIRGAKQFINAIEGTADYIEAYNYYNVALGKIASEWNQDWEKYGYANAEAYADSFTDRLNKSLSKLSGLQIDESQQLLTETGLKNLGLNIQEITQYASQLASITNSIGQTGEVSLAAASAFTKLAGDMSSLFNVDYSSVFGNLQSALIGQSRAVYKYGIDITNATLQTYAYNLGLEKAVSEMTQAEKMQLRMIAILDQSRVSWGDLSRTLNSPSNLMRQFTNNVKEAGMVLGQLFIPVLQKVLPVVNGVVIAIKRLLVSIAQLLGVKLDLDSFGQGYTDLTDGFDDMADSLDGVASSAKKAKAGLRAFDELKVINMPETSGGAGGVGGGAIDLTDEILKATNEYEKAWQEAYDRMASKAQDFADKISGMLEPVKKIFEDFAVGDFFQAGEDTSHLVASIFNFFADAIDRVDWYGIGQNIGDFLAGIDWVAVLNSIGNLIWQAINAAIEFWKGSFDSAPIQTTILTAVAFMKWTGIGGLLAKGLKNSILKAIGAEKGKNLGIALLKWFKKGFISIGTKIGSLVKGLFSGTNLAAAFSGASSSISSVAAALSGVISLIGGGILSVVNFVKMLMDGFSWLNEILMVIGTALAAVGAVLLGAEAAVAAIVAGIVAGISTVIVLIHDNWESIKSWLSQAASWINENVIQPIINFFVGLGTRIQQIFEGAWIIVQAIWQVASTWFYEKVVNPIVNFFSPIAKSISGFFESAWNGVKDTWKKVSNWFNINIIIPVVSDFKAACDKISGFFSNLWLGIKKGVIGAMNAVIGGIESGINFMIGGINDIISGFNRVVSWAASIIEVEWSGVDLVPTVSIPRIQGYEIGGFPKPYSLFAAGEGGRAELLGTVGGQTAVAGGAEITGIRDAVLSSHREEMELMRQQNELLRGILVKEFGITEQQIGKAASNYSREYMKRTGKPAYSF